MISFQHHTKRTIALSIFTLVLFLGFRGSHPVSNGGYTGAPGDGVCAQCHNGNNTALLGDLVIENLPNSIDPGQTYSLTARLSNPSTNAVRGGFQMVAMDDTDSSVGSFSNLPSDADVKTSSGNQYIGHALESRFDGNPDISWSFDWTAPSNISGNEIDFYYVSILGNGANGNGNDRFIIHNETVSFNGVSLPLEANLTAIDDSPCADTNEGHAAVSASEGTPPYMFSWSNGETGNEVFNLPIGQNFVTVTDNASGQVILDFTIGSPPLLELNVITVNPAPCNGIDGGSATVLANGGSGNYIYSWPGGLNGGSQSNLLVGTYNVTVNDDNNCEATVDVVIDAVPVLMINEVSSNDPSCLGGNDGSIEVAVTGGTMPLSILWSNSATSTSIMDLEAGDYSVTVMDANNCASQFSTTLNEGEEVVIGAAIITDVDCFGSASGSIITSVSGGTGTYTYQWISASSFSSNTQNLIDVIAGTYELTVFDENLCSSSATYTIGEPTVIIGNVINKVDVTCANGNDGSADVTASGGVSPYNFAWPSGIDPSMLSSGAYRVTISDANNCTALSFVNINELSTPLIVGVSATNETTIGAMDGTATVIAAGGITPYTYLWSTGDTIPNLDSLSSGTYSITVTDTLGCQGEGSGFVPSGDCVLSATSSITPNRCFGDSTASISLDVMNITSNNSFLWSNGDTTSTIENLTAGSYSVSISDENDCFFLLTAIRIVDPPLLTVSLEQIGDLSCNTDSALLSFTSSNMESLQEITWSTGGSGDTISIDSAGLYYISIKDSSACNATDTLLVAGIDSLPPVFNFISNKLYLDENGSTNIENLNTLVSDNCGVDSVNIASIDTLDCRMLEDTVAVNVYAVDLNGNSTTDTFFFILLDTIKPSIVCEDTLFYQSCDTIRYDQIIGTDNCGFINSTSSVDYNNQVLDVGHYTVQHTIIDQSGNSSSCATVLSVSNGIQSNVETLDVSCFGLDDGSFEILDIAGGVGHYSIVFDDILIPANLASGTYFYTITDSLGCELIDSVHIAEANPISLDSAIINDETNSGSKNGSIGILTSGGQGQLLFSWMNEDGEILGSNSFLTGLAAGTYTLTITDQNDCSVSFSFEVGVLTSVHTLAEEASLFIYPNPVRDLLYLELGERLSNSTISVYDINGACIMNQAYGNEGFIDMSRLEIGTYLIKIQSSNEVFVKRFMKL